MSSKQIPTYATEGDLIALLTEVAKERALSYVPFGLFDSPTLSILSDPRDLKPFGTYLLFDKATHLETRLVSQRDGSTKFAVDQLCNANTLSLHCGGLVGERKLIAGSIGTGNKSKQADEIFLLLKKVIRRKFEKIKAYEVGPEAARLLDAGVRLAPTLKSPETYDLVR